MQSSLVSAGDTFGAKSVTRSPTLSNSVADMVLVKYSGDILVKLWQLFIITLQLEAVPQSQLAVSDACLSSFRAHGMLFPGILPLCLFISNDRSFSL